MIQRSEAERELNRLLKRALRSVPFVRLDKVEEVTEKFKVACTLLEHNLDDDFDLNNEDDDGPDESGINIPRSVPTEGGRPDSDSDDDEDEEEREEKERQEKEQKALEDKEREARIRPKPGEAVRKDFSSPDIRSRGLKAQAAASSEEPARKGGIGASSRAGMSSRAKPSGDSSETTNPRIGLKTSTAASRAKDGDLRKQALIKNKKPPGGDVAVSKDRFTKDEGTPRLGGRSLLMKAGADGARSKSSIDLFRGEEDNTAVLARDATSDSHSSRDDSASGQFAAIPKKPSSRAASNLSAIPGGESTTGTSKDEEGDSDEDLPITKKKSLTKGLPKDILSSSSRRHQQQTKNPHVDRITEQALETPHSPLQLSAHRTLLSIASKGSSTTSSPPQQQQTGITPSDISDIGDIIPISQKVETPKPAFLRRLDSPKTNHGILIAHKARLNKMIRRAKRGIPHMKLDHYDKIKQAFLQAVELLEQSTTMASAKKDNIATADPTSKILLG